VTALPFHDAVEDGDFSVVYDLDDDGEYDFPSFTNLMAIVQGPDPLGRQVLYVAGKQGNSSALTEDSVIFRIEYATAFTPYAGPTGRVPDGCFTGGVYSGGGSGTPPYGYENPFQRTSCLPPSGPCPGQPDGTPCDAAIHAAARRRTSPASASTGHERPTAPRAAPATSAARPARVRRAHAWPARPCGRDAVRSDDPCTGQALCTAGVCGDGRPAAARRARR
jgi:hypothetical protein